MAEELGANGAGDGPAMEIDLDGDGRPDVLVPGLGETPRPELHPGRADVEAYEAMADYDPPPSSSNLSPMGQIEHMGYALHSQTARTGWRHKVIQVVAWGLLAVLAASLIAGLFR